MENVSKVEFRNAIEKISDYVHMFNGNKPAFTEQSAVDGSPMATTMITHGLITTAVVLALPKGEAQPHIIFSAGVCKLPKENVVAFFRQLLVWNNLATDVAHFAVSDNQETVFLVARRPIQNFDYSEFKNVLEKMSTITANAILMLNKQFKM